MPLYYGNKKIEDVYVGSTKIGQIYVGSTLVYTSWKDKFITSTGQQTVTLPKGRYTIIIRASGGAGGQQSRRIWYSSGDANGVGYGGAGGKGEIVAQTVDISSKQQVTVYLGTVGTTYGNGGEGGDSYIEISTNVYAKGGKGGGGAYPAYVKGTSFTVVAQGGGGGGGGGSAGSHGRRAKGGPGGGGGGGYYILSNAATIIPMNGKKGATGANYYNYGNAGTAGVTDYGGGAIYSGAGGGGSHHKTGQGGAGAVGFGASGGSGNAGDKNNDTHKSAKGGGGGGGAGGGLTAHGGGHPVQGWGTNPTEATNATYVADDVSAENAAYGVSGNYGKGGNGGFNPEADYVNGSNGTAGFIKIIKEHSVSSTLDLGQISDSSISSTINCGSITDTSISETKNMGAI